MCVGHTPTCALHVPSPIELNLRPMFPNFHSIWVVHFFFIVMVFNSINRLLKSSFNNLYIVERITQLSLFPSSALHISKPFFPFIVLPLRKNVFPLGIFMVSTLNTIFLKKGFFLIWGCGFRTIWLCYFKFSTCTVEIMHVEPKDRDRYKALKVSLMAIVFFPFKQVN